MNSWSEGELGYKLWESFGVDPAWLTNQPKHFLTQLIWLADKEQCTDNQTKIKENIWVQSLEHKDRTKHVMLDICKFVTSTQSDTPMTYMFLFDKTKHALNGFNWSIKLNSIPKHFSFYNVNLQIKKRFIKTSHLYPSHFVHYMKSEKIKINVNVYRAFKITIRITIPKLSWELPFLKKNIFVTNMQLI